MRHVFVALILTFLFMPHGAAAQIGDFSVTGALFLGGGYSGINEPTLVNLERLNDQGVVDPDFIDVTVDLSWKWRPTLTVGAEVRFGDLPNVSDNYWGIGGFFASLSQENESNAVAPGAALILHIGPIGFMVGYIFTQSDEIRLPNGVKRLTVPRNNQLDFRTPGTRSLGRLFIGIRGVTLSFGEGDGSPATTPPPPATDTTAVDGN